MDISGIYPPIGGLYATYHLLGEPETTIELKLKRLFSGWDIDHKFQVMDRRRDLFISPFFWRSRFQPLISGHVNSLTIPLKGHKLAELPGMRVNLPHMEHLGICMPWGPNSQCPVVGDKLINTIP